MKKRQINSLMFLANDTLGHDICWSGKSETWFMENEREGFLAFYAGLDFALERMSKITGVSVDNFSVMHNPYTHTE
jgi:hypothetical protein